MTESTALLTKVLLSTTFRVGGPWCSVDEIRDALARARRTMSGRVGVSRGRRYLGRIRGRLIFVAG